MLHNSNYILHLINVIYFYLQVRTLKMHTINRFEILMKNKNIIPETYNFRDKIIKKNEMKVIYVERWNKQPYFNLKSFFLIESPLN